MPAPGRTCICDGKGLIGLKWVHHLMIPSLSWFIIRLPFVMPSATAIRRLVVTAAPGAPDFCRGLKHELAEGGGNLGGGVVYFGEGLPSPTRTKSPRFFNVPGGRVVLRYRDTQDLCRRVVGGPALCQTATGAPPRAFWQRWFGGRPGQFVPLAHEDVQPVTAGARDNSRRMPEDRA